MEKEKTYTETVDEKIRETDAKNKERIDKFANYQKMRVESAGRELPTPMSKDPKTGLVVWHNRAARRKMKK